jgi:retrotransposon gag protein/zinc knuckle protein
MTSYYATLRGASIVIANYGGVWFEVELWQNRTVAVRPAQAVLRVKHFPYPGMNLQGLVDSGEPTPAELQQSCPPSWAATEAHSEPEQDDAMREKSSMAKGKDPRRPRGTGDDPFSIWDLPQDNEKGSPGGRLEGNPPEKFSGDRSDTSDFLMWFKQFMSLNHTSAIARDPIRKATYFLSFMTGTKTKGWTRMQSLWLQDAEEDPSIIPATRNAWQMVEHDFKQTFVDYAIKEKAQDELHKLQMKERNIDQYIANFSLLAMDAQVDPDEPTILLLFYQGLPQRLAEKCIELDSLNDFTSWTKAAQRNQCNWILTQALWRKGGKPSNAPRPGNPPPARVFPWNNKGQGQRGSGAWPARPRLPPTDPNMMDISTARKAMTDAEKQKHWQEGRCFECSQQGHLARNCPLKKNRPRINRAFSSVVDNRLVTGTENNDFQLVTSMASRVKGMTDEEKDEFIRLINDDEEQDFAEAWVP